MMQRCFSVFDSKTNYFQPPFFSPTTPSGVRMFENLCRDPNTMAHKFPEDFQLFQIGQFDDTTGKFQPQVPECVCTASQFVMRVEPAN